LAKYIGALLLTAVLCYAGCYIVISNTRDEDKYVNAYNEAYKNEAVLPEAEAGQIGRKEEMLLEFVSNNLLGKNGEIRSNAGPYGEGSATLSESVGLLMNYCVLRGKRGLFQKEFDFLKTELFAGGTGIKSAIKWKTGKDVSCNAAIDDLRIIRALLDAYEKWGDKEYFNAAGFIQHEIYDKQVRGGCLREFYDWGQKDAGGSIPLCYIDLYTIYRISAFNENWIRVLDRGLSVIKGGRIGEDGPFLYKYYNCENGAYSVDEEFNNSKGICLTYTLYTMLHLAEMNEDTGRFSEWLNGEMEKGRLYAWYNPYTLKPAGKIESTAVYALAAVYAKKTGDNELCGKIIDSMLKFMITDQKSPYCGGFGNGKTGDFYSFDNLTALWALALAER